MVADRRLTKWFSYDVDTHLLEYSGVWYQGGIKPKSATPVDLTDENASLNGNLYSE